MPCFILLSRLLHSCPCGIRNQLAIRLPHLLRNNTCNLDRETEFPIPRQQSLDVSNLLVDHHRSILLVWLWWHRSPYLRLLLPKRNEPFLYWNYWTYVRPQHSFSHSTYLYHLLLTVHLADSVNINMIKRLI